MIQTKEQTYQQQFDMYMGVEKEELVKMLIECNKHLQSRIPIVKLPKNICNYYQSGTDTSCRCIHCGKTKWEHSQYISNNY